MSLPGPTLIVFTAIALLMSAGPSSADTPVETAMVAAGVDTALVFPGIPADEEPIWSPDGQAVGINVMGDWLGFNLAGLTFDLADWHEQTVGIISGADENTPFSLDAGQVREWRAATVNGTRRVTTPNGTLLELAEDGFSVNFSVTLPGAAPKVLWATGGENCHSMGLSPDARVVLFICEQNGVFAYLVP